MNRENFHSTQSYWQMWRTSGNHQISVCGGLCNFLLQVTVQNFCIFPMEDNFHFSIGPVVSFHQWLMYLPLNDNPVCDFCFQNDVYFSQRSFHKYIFIKVEWYCPCNYKKNIFLLTTLWTSFHATKTFFCSIHFNACLESQHLDRSSFISQIPCCWAFRMFPIFQHWKNILVANLCSLPFFFFYNKSFGFLQSVCKKN